MNNQELEAKIQQAKHRFLFSITQEKRHKYWAEYIALIAQRSPEMIARLEREKGLV